MILGLSDFQDRLMVPAFLGVVNGGFRETQLEPFVISNPN